MTEEKKDHTTTVKILTLVDEEAAESQIKTGAGYDPYDKSQASESSQTAEKE